MGKLDYIVNRTQDFKGRRVPFNSPKIQRFPVDNRISAAHAVAAQLKITGDYFDTPLVQLRMTVQL